MTKVKFFFRETAQTLSDSSHGMSYLHWHFRMQIIIVTILKIVIT